MFTLTKIDVSEDTVECIWRSSHFRAAIRRKFEEVIVADNSNADSRAIEEQLFAKVKTKDEFLKPIAYTKILEGACSSIAENNLGITHVVAGITYGGNLNIEIEKADKKLCPQKGLL